MKKTVSVLLFAATMLFSVLSASAGLLSPGLLVISGEDPLTVSGIKGEPVLICSADICRHSGINYFDSIKITSLPDISKGVLSIDSVAVSVGQEISFTDADRLVFAPNENVTDCSFTYEINSVATTCSLIFTDQINLPPVATSFVAPIEAFSGSSVSGNMVAYDPDGDSMTYYISSHPENGNISYSRTDGSFVYTPASTGKDSFSFTVRDSYGNYSDEATVELSVFSNTSGISFSDMKNSSAFTAAVVMVDNGIMASAEDNGNAIFEPSLEVSRLDFLICAMNTMGATNIPTVSNTGFADDNAIPDESKGYVYSAKALGIINGQVGADEMLYFNPDAPITRAEAAVIINNIIGYTAQGNFNFGDSVPVWAEDAVSAMFELGVLSKEDGNIMADSPITEEEAAMALHRINNLIF